MKGLKERREQAGLSQDQLANILGVDRTTVTKWETENGFPRVSRLNEIAKALHCTVDELVREVKK